MIVFFGVTKPQFFAAYTVVAEENKGIAGSHP